MIESIMLIITKRSLFIIIGILGTRVIPLHKEFSKVKAERVFNKDFLGVIVVLSIEYIVSIILILVLEKTGTQFNYCSEIYIGSSSITLLEKLLKDNSGKGLKIG